MYDKKVVTLHKRISTMKKERKAFILSRVREIANSERIDGAMRNDLEEFCSEVGVEYRVGHCDNCARDTAVQIYSILRTKSGADRVCVLKNERYQYVWSAKGKAHIYTETLTDEMARELLDSGILKEDFFQVLPPTKEELASSVEETAQADGDSTAETAGQG